MPIRVFFFIFFFQADTAYFAKHDFNVTPDATHGIRRHQNLRNLPRHPFLEETFVTLST